ncbi:MAG TPA: hypothetical protein VKA05_07445 [Acidimicrobiales bacterium]|nr:hypothetical protein [Acidimicrobiales bacterium]
MSLQRRDVDRLLAPEFVQGLADAPVAELRRRRDQCRRVEDLVSYLRRVVQGQLDLIHAEIEMRVTGSGGDDGRLVDDLPSILAGSPAGGAGGGAEHAAGAWSSGHQGTSLLAIPAVADMFSEYEELSPTEIAAVIAPELVETTFQNGTLPGANLGTYSDAELRKVMERLGEHETQLSAERRILHEQIDHLQAMIVERYKTGAADADALLGDQKASGRQPEAVPRAGDGTP